MSYVNQQKKEISSGKEKRINMIEFSFMFLFYYIGTEKFKIEEEILFCLSV